MTAPTLPICERLRRDFDGEPFDTAICRDVNALCGTVEALVQALEWYREQVEGCRKLGSIGDPFRHALDADGGKRAKHVLTLAREGAPHDQQ